MDFNKIKGFWDDSSAVSDLINNTSSSVASKSNNSNNNNNKNNNKNLKGNTDDLDEIKPEITEEGYGLRAPYGTHVSLDFVKYCEDITSGFQAKQSFAKSRRRTTSSTGPARRPYGFPSRLSKGPSTESLEAAKFDINMGQGDGNADNTLMETRRRLEAYRSFRSKRFKSQTENLVNPPYLLNARSYIRTDSNGSNKINNGLSGHGIKSTGELGACNESACSSSSGSATPSSLSSLPINSPLIPQHLHVMREQMAAALAKLREYEELVPELRKEIGTLKQQNKILEEKIDLQNSIQSRSPGVSPINNELSPNGLRSSPVTPLNNNSFSKSFIQRSKLKYPDGVIGSPPVPPKRKYKSTGTGDETPIDEIICYRKHNNSSNLDNKLSQQNYSLNYDNSVNQGFKKGSSVPMLSMDTNTAISMKKYDFPPQNVNPKSKEASTQTDEKNVKSVGCDAKSVKTEDSACEPISPEDLGIVEESPIKTDDKSTSTQDLVMLHHKLVGIDVETKNCSTSTIPPSLDSKMTSCDELVTLKDIKCGPDQMSTYVSSATCTAPVPTSNVAVGCDEEPPLTTDNSTMTTTTEGRWVSYTNVRDSACCTEKMETFSTATSTDSISTQHKETETNNPVLSNKGFQVDIRAATNNAATLTTPALKYNQATDCADIKPVLRHNATNTIRMKSTSVATQYVTNRSNLVDSMVNTIHVERNDASTSTLDISSKTIDEYVDKVESLLEEQQLLLAKNYEGFSGETFDGKTEKVSRFINPAFQKNNVDQADPPPAADPISVSLSLIEEEKEREDSSSSEYDSDSSDLFMTATLRPLPSPECEANLKSIMKKPGTQSTVKKSLRFAEGVKSDDDSSDTSSYDESSSEDEDDREQKDDRPVQTIKIEIIVNENEKKEDEKEKEKVNDATIAQKQPSPPKNNIPNHTKENQTEFNYSNEFVRKVPSVNEEPVEKNTPSETLNNIEDKVISSPKVAKEVESIVIEAPNHVQEHTAKYIFTPQVLASCDVLEKHLRNPKLIEKSDLILAKSVIQQEWFVVAAQMDSSKRLVDDFVRDLADTSLPVLRKVVNMTDSSGNTVLHYAISHGNVSVVDSLLSIDELDVNKTNQAGYTSAMLASLCDVSTDIERTVYKKLFSKSDVNAHAKEAGQTALMLAVSHGRLSTAQLLLNCGADINARDEDGSTALMCAVEHGQLEAVKILLSRPNCDATIADNDGSTALGIAMDAGHREIAILLYAQLNFRSNTNKAPRPRTACKSMIPSPIQKPVKS